MSVTTLVSHTPMGRLNADVLCNILFMSKTERVFQFVISCVKERAPLNMYAMDVTALVFQSLISALNDPAFKNNELILVTRLVSHKYIGLTSAAPQSTAAFLQSQFPVGSTAKQLSTAVFNALLLRNASPDIHDEGGPDVTLVQRYLA